MTRHVNRTYIDRMVPELESEANVNDDEISKLSKVFAIGIATVALWIILNEWKSNRADAKLDQRIQAIERKLGTQ